MYAPVTFNNLSTLSPPIDQLLQNVARTMRLDPFRSCFSSIRQKNEAWNRAVAPEGVTWYCLFLPAPTFQTNRPNSIDNLSKEFGFLKVAVDALRWMYIKTDSQQKAFFLEEMPNIGIRLHFLVAVNKKRFLQQVREGGGELDEALANEFKAQADLDEQVADAARQEALARAKARTDKQARDGSMGKCFASPETAMLDAVNRPAGRDIRPGPAFPRGLSTAVKDMNDWRDMAIAIGAYDARKFGRRRDFSISMMEQMEADEALQSRCPYFKYLTDKIAKLEGELAETSHEISEVVAHCMRPSDLTNFDSKVCPRRIFDPDLAFKQAELTYLLYVKEAVARADGDEAVVEALQREREQIKFFDADLYGPASQRAASAGRDMVVKVGNPYFCQLSQEDVRDIFLSNLPRQVMDQILVLMEVLMDADNIQTSALEMKRVNVAANAAVARPLALDADPNDLEAAVDQAIGNMAGVIRSARNELDMQDLRVLGREDAVDWTCLIGFRDDREADPPLVWHFRRTLLAQRLANMYTAYHLNSSPVGDTTTAYDKYANTRLMCIRANLELDSLASLPHVSSQQRATLLECKVRMTQAALSAPYMECQLISALDAFLDDLDTRGDHIHVPLRQMYGNTDCFGNVLITMQSALSEVFVVTTNFGPIFHCYLAALAGNMPDDIINNRIAPHVFLSAPPGVGKTFLLFLLKDVMLLPNACELSNHASAMANIAQDGIKRHRLTVFEPELSYENLVGNDANQKHVGSGNGPRLLMEQLMGNVMKRSTAAVQNGQLIVTSSTSQANGTNLYAGNIEKKQLTKPAQRRLTDLTMVEAAVAILSKLVALLISPTSLRSQAKVAYTGLFHRIHAVHIRLCDMMHYGMIPTPSTEVAMPIIWRIMEDLNAPDSPVQVEITAMQRLMMRIMASCILRVSAYAVTGEKSPLAHNNLREDNTEGRVNIRGAMLVVLSPLLVVTTADIVRGLQASMCEFTNPVRTAVMNELLSFKKKFPLTAVELTSLLRSTSPALAEQRASTKGWFSTRRIVGRCTDNQLDTFDRQPRRRQRDANAAREEEGQEWPDVGMAIYDAEEEKAAADDDAIRPDGRLPHSEAVRLIEQYDKIEYAFLQVDYPHVELVDLDPVPESKTGIAGGIDRRRKRKTTGAGFERDAHGMVQTQIVGVSSTTYAVGRFPEAFKRLERDSKLAKGLAHLAYSIARSMSGTGPDEIVAYLIPLASTSVALGPLPWASDAYNNSHAANKVQHTVALHVTENNIHVHLPTIYAAKNNSVMAALLKRLSHRHAKAQDIVVAESTGERNNDFKVLRIRPNPDTELNLRICKPSNASRGTIAAEQLRRLMSAGDAADFIESESKLADTVVRVRTDTDQLAIHESFARFIPMAKRAEYERPEDRIELVQTLFNDVARRSGLKAFNLMECFDDMLGQPADQPGDKPVYDPKDVAPVRRSNGVAVNNNLDAKEEKKRAPPPPLRSSSLSSSSRNRTRHSSSSSSSSSSWSDHRSDTRRSSSSSTHAESKSPLELTRTLSALSVYGQNSRREAIDNLMEDLAADIIDDEDPPAYKRRRVDSLTAANEEDGDCAIEDAPRSPPPPPRRRPPPPPPLSSPGEIIASWKPVHRDDDDDEDFGF